MDFKWLDFPNIFYLTQKDLKVEVVRFLKKRGIDFIEKDWGIVANPDGKVMLSAHLDLYGDIPPDVVMEKEGRLIGFRKSKFGLVRSVLGGDDRVGVWIALSLMENEVWDYSIAFFVDEEKGGIGSTKAVLGYDFGKYNAFVGLDRRGNGDVAVYGYDNRELIKIFEDVGYKRAIGSFTDVVNLSKVTNVACVNISVGFYNEHTPNEYVNINDTLRTFNVLIDENIRRKLLSRRYESKGTCGWWGWRVMGEEEEIDKPAKGSGLSRMWGGINGRYFRSKKRRRKRRK